MDTKWLEADQAAALLNQTPDELERYGRSAWIRTRGSGRHVQYRRSDVEALARRQNGAAPLHAAAIAPEVGRALVETLGMARELIETQRQLLAAQAELAQLRGEVAHLQAQRQRYIAIIRALQDRARH
jgi:hypothetical protein